MKRWLLLLLSAVLILGCAGCRTTPACEKSLNKMLGYLENGKITKAEKYTSDGTLNVNLKNRYAKNFYKLMFQSMSYVISDSTVSGDSAQVAVSVTMVDMEALVADVSLAMLDNTFQGERNANREFYTLVTNKIQAGDITYVTNSATVYMTKSDGGWKVNMSKSSSFADAITGGLGELIGY